MILGIASGKGGTGKTTVAVNLAGCAPEPALLLDCDVEEPNCHLFLQTQLRSRGAVTIPVPVLDAAACNGCGQCREICQFHAVAMLGGRPVFFPDLCHGCGGCTWACPTGAVHETGQEIGVVEVCDAGRTTLVQGRLHVGKALSPPLIHAVKRAAAGRKTPGPTLIDGPPGTACSMAAALSGCNYALLVAEPTRFGAHDLGLAVESLRQIHVPFGVVINRSRGRSNPVRDLCSHQGIPVLAELPESREAAAQYARGRLLVETVPGMRAAFEALWATVEREVAAHAPAAEVRP